MHMILIITFYASGWGHGAAHGTESMMEFNSISSCRKAEIAIHSMNNGDQFSTVCVEK